MAVQIKLPTVEEYMAFGDKPVEVVDGEFVEMSPSMRRQPEVMSNISDDLGPFVRKRKLGRVYSEVSYVLDGDPRRNWVKNARQPDVSFITQVRITEHKKKHPEPGPWWLAPDLAVEVMSPNDTFPEVDQKIRDYLK
jgi:Uma2 family endonuclease